MTKKHRFNVLNAGQNLSQNKPELKLDYCSYKAAKYAVDHWHYSRRMPDPKTLKIGVWEGTRFIGVVIFSRGVSATNISKSLNISSVEIAELSRVALDKHFSPTTKIISIALRMLKLQSPGLRLVISYADANQGHLGILYQAGNWIYTGQSAAVPLLHDKAGRLIHDRACSASGIKRQFGVLKRVPRRADLVSIPQLKKYRYMMPLDDKMRQVLVRLRKPYPKRAGSDTVDTSGFHPEKGGLEPTPALQKRKTAYI